MSIYGKDAYFEKYNLRYVYAPKTGWTSLRNADVGFKWVSPEDLPNDCKSFSVYRDPYDRFKSGYKEVIGRGIRNEPDLVENIPLEKYMTIQLELRKYEFGSYDSIRSYIDSIVKFGVWDGHQISYVDSLKDPQRGRENIDVEQITFLDFKHLNHEFSEFVGEKVVVPFLQRGARVDNDVFEKFREEIDLLCQNDYNFINDIVLSNGVLK